MFDIARAALLRAGVPENKLPRTHNGVTEAFRDYAVQSGQIDKELGAELSRIQSLRIKADYTGAEIERGEAAEVVEKAEIFVRTVERAFSLDESSLGNEYKNHTPNDDDKVSEPAEAVSKVERKDLQFEPVSLEEIRRQARENWLRLRQQKIEGAKGAGRDHETDLEAKRSQELDDDLNE